MSWEDEKKLLWAQADHIDLLAKEARAAGAQKKQAEEIEAKKNNEAFLLAQAMGAIPEGASSAEKKDGSSQEDVQAVHGSDTVTTATSTSVTASNTVLNR